MVMTLVIAYLIIAYINCNVVRGYHGKFPHLFHTTFLVAAVSAHYQMFTPIINISKSYLLFNPGNSCCLVMRLGFTGSPFT